MAFIAKIDPIEVDIGHYIQIEERAMYGGRSISLGDRIFIWTSETTGGCGLVAAGTVTFLNFLGSNVFAEVFLDTAALRQLGLDNISSYRDVQDSSPESELARVLYRHAHNKISALGETTCQFLESYFV